MVPTQTLETYPPFGDNATKVQPDNAKYAAGFQPADVYPAEWVNWAWGKNTRCITDLNAGVNMMEKEINNVLDGAGKTPDATKENQLLQSIQKLISDAETRAKLAAHPIGSLYWSSDSTDPGTLFGGTWARIKDKFILAAGDTYTNGATGGAATVTLQTTEIPSHNHGMNNHTHSFTPSGSISGGAYKFAGTAATLKATAGGSISGGAYKFTGSQVSTENVTSYANTYFTAYVDTGVGKSSNVTFSGEGGGAASGPWLNSRTVTINTNHSHKVTASGTISVTTNPTFTGTEHSHSYTPAGSVSVTTNPSFSGTAGTTGQASGNTGSTGGGGAHNNMPPYLVKYCWERTA